MEPITQIFLTMLVLYLMLIVTLILNSFLEARVQKLEKELSEMIGEKDYVVTEYGTGLALVVDEAERLPLNYASNGEFDRYLYFRKGTKPDADYAEESCDKIVFKKKTVETTTVPYKQPAK